MNLKNFEKNLFKPEYLFIFLILFQITIGLISWLAFFKAASDPNLIYHSLKSYFLPVEITGGLRKSLAEIFNISVSSLNLEYFHISFSQLKLKTSYKVMEELARWFIIIVYGVSWFFIIRLKAFRELSSRKIFFYSAILFSVAGLCLPNDSSDIYGYIARGAQQVFFNQNPYQEVVSSVEGWRQNIFFTNMLWENNPAPYGPLFMLLCRGIVFISFDNFWISLFLFKLINVISFFILVKVLMILFNSKNLDSVTETTASSYFGSKQLLLVLLFNPLFLMEIAWNGHNDILMCLFICISFLCMQKNKFGLALLMMLIATLIKYLSIILIPLILIAAFKYSSNIKKLFSSLSCAGLISLLITAFSIIHYRLLEIDHSRFQENLTLSHKSLFSSLNAISQGLFKFSLTSEAKYVFFTAFIIFAVYLYVKFLFIHSSISQESPRIDNYSETLFQELLNNAFLLMMGLILFTSPKFHSWYLLGFLPFGFISFPGISLALSFTHLLSFTVIDQAKILNFALMSASVFILRRFKKNHKSVV
jgi:hypothetical protein